MAGRVDGEFRESADEGRDGSGDLITSMQQSTKVVIGEILCQILQIPHYPGVPLISLSMSQYFDAKAVEWDADERRRQLSSAIGSSILAHIPLDDRMDVRDFGAETGLISTYVAPRVNKIVAVYTSKAMLATRAAKQDHTIARRPAWWVRCVLSGI